MLNEFDQSGEIFKTLELFPISVKELLLGEMLKATETSDLFSMFGLRPSWDKLLKQRAARDDAIGAMLTHVDAALSSSGQNEGKKLNQ